jgi:hypothetical protein
MGCLEIGGAIKINRCKEETQETKGTKKNLGLSDRDVLRSKSQKQRAHAGFCRRKETSIV